MLKLKCNLFTASSLIGGDLVVLYHSDRVHLIDARAWSTTCCTLDGTPLTLHCAPHKLPYRCVGHHKMPSFILLITWTHYRVRFIRNSYKFVFMNYSEWYKGPNMECSSLNGHHRMLILLWSSHRTPHWSPMSSKEDQNSIVISSELLAVVGVSLATIVSTISVAKCATISIQYVWGPLVGYKL